MATPDNVDTIDQPQLVVVGQLVTQLEAMEIVVSPHIEGFLAEPKKSAGGDVYRGRFTCPRVQWTGSGSDAFATFTITATELADAAGSRLLWTDQDVQRGIRPEASPRPARELSLAEGYPDPAKYIFDAQNADDIVDKLLQGKTLFLNPLVWNLRPGTFSAYWNSSESALYVYEGKIYLPDSHHRQQAIVKAVETWRSAPQDYPRFSGNRQFKIELYFLSREDEGNYFFDKNTRPKPTAKSKAYDLTTLDDISLLAKRMIEHSQHLDANVNRVTDRLSAGNLQVITLSTLREMMKSFAPSDALDPTELDGIATVAAKFYDMLAKVRPELGRQTLIQRREVRRRLIVDAAVMMHGYAALMKDFYSDTATLGSRKADREWERKLGRLSGDRVFSFGSNWAGDLFEKRNPLWQQLGIVKPAKGGKLSVLNTGATRLTCGAALRKVVASDDSETDLKSIAWTR